MAVVISCTGGRRGACGMRLLAVLAATATACQPRPRQASWDPQTVLSGRVEGLRARLRLAESDTLLLILDPFVGSFILARGGATLREWSVSEISAGKRRLGFGRGVDRPDWRTRIWSAAQLDPPVRRERRVLVSDTVAVPDLSGAVDWIPPTPEEAVPTPPRFLVHYAEGLGVEVIAVGAPSARGLRGLLRRGSSLAREVLPASWDRYRIRVMMPAAEAGSLYRSFPDDAALLALLSGSGPPSSGGGASRTVSVGEGVSASARRGTTLRTR